MKKIFFCCSISILIISAGLQAIPGRISLSTEEKLFLSKLDEDFLEDEDPDEWVIFIKQFGRDKIAVQLPRQPQLKYQKDANGFETYTYLAHEDEIHYSLTIETKPRERQEIEENFQKIIDEFKEHPYQKLLHFSRSEGHLGPQLDLTYLDPWASNDDTVSVCKKRILASPGRVYTFFTTRPEFAEDKHEVFADSFHIIKPLGS